jgi:hypothetical protein
VWRVVFQSGAVAEAAPVRTGGAETPQESASPPASVSEGEALVSAFYRQWGGEGQMQPGAKDLEQAQVLLLQAEGKGEELLGCLIQVVRKQWPQCRSLSGAVQKYLSDALKVLRQQQQREAVRAEAELQRQTEQQQQLSQQSEQQLLLGQWQGLAEEERLAIRQAVLARLTGPRPPEAFVRTLCLEEMKRHC